ncbi:MAG: DUF29 domain-containing protein [Acetobacteraceae bacterium]|nr:DUF29 domain-containing protein [Acetobacteraceae bacterium]
MSKTLYEQDFALWSTEQGRAIRQAAAARLNTPAPIDWENVAEEIETLGRSERSALRSHLLVIAEHLMKLEASPAKAPRADWTATVETQRSQIEALLSDSPSLRREVAPMLEWAVPRARRIAAASLAKYRERPRTDITQLTYTEDQVLGDWFPTPPTAR